MKKLILSLSTVACVFGSVSASAANVVKQVTIQCNINQQVLVSQFSGTLVLAVNDDNTVNGTLTYSTFIPGPTGVVAGGSPVQVSGTMSIVPAGDMYINQVESYQVVNNSQPATVSLAITTDTKDTFSSRLLLNGEDEYSSFCDYK